MMISKRFVGTVLDGAVVGVLVGTMKAFGAGWERVAWASMALVCGLIVLAVGISVVAQMNEDRK